MKLNKHFYKISGLCLLAIFIAIASIILILLGSEIGYINSLMVFAAFSVCGIIVISIELAYTFIIAIYKTYRLKPANIDRDIVNEASDFEGPLLTRKDKIQKSFDFFLLKNKFDNIYTLTPKQRAHTGMKKKYIVRYADLITDLYMFMVYLIILALIILSSRDKFAFFSTRASIRQFMNGHYFNNGTREPIHTELFYDYLECDFLPTIHMSK